MEYRIVRSNEYLEHHGIKGQKHGQRRFQNEDGSLTAEGREHYGIGGPRQAGGQYSSNTGTGRNQSTQARSGGGIRGFYNRHKTGVKIAAGVLAAGLAAAAVTQIIKSNNSKKGAESVKQILSQNDSHGLRTSAPSVARPNNYSGLVTRSSSNYSGGYNAKRTAKELSNFKRNVSKATKNNQKLMRELDRMNADVMRKFGGR